MLSLFTHREFTFDEKLKSFSKAAGNELIVTMLSIFMLSGIFSQLGSDIGALKILTSWIQEFLPEQLFIVGIFLFACFLSITIGTSVGTIVALAPLAGQIGFIESSHTYYLLGAIVGGAMFGDNLSFISDTTIAVTKTHGIAMKEKFKANLLLVLPAAILSLLFYFLVTPTHITSHVTSESSFKWEDVILVSPYFFVLVLVFFNINLFIALCLGIFGFLLTGYFMADLTFSVLLSSTNTGVLSLTELCMITFFLGGLSGFVHLFGGFDRLLILIKEKANSKIKASYSIAVLSGFTNMLLANNTLSIIIVGPLAKEIAEKNNIPMKRSASIVDTMTCCVQGLLPYGAQLLLAVSLSGVSISALQLLPFMIYPILIGVSTLIAIPFLGLRKEKKS